MYEELEKGYSNINNVLDWFQEEEIINYLTSIMAYDFEITEVNKCIEAVSYTHLTLPTILLV